MQAVSPNTVRQKCTK